MSDEITTTDTEANPLFDGTIEWRWSLVPVGSQQRFVLAETLDAAEAIAKLAFPRQRIGKAGVAKNKPPRGEMVVVQVEAPAIDEEKTAGKDIREANRRDGLNYESYCW